MPPLRATIANGIITADTAEVRSAFAACDSALDRCRSPEDFAYVSGIVQQLRRDTVLYGVHDRMQRASERMAGLRGAR